MLMDTNNTTRFDLSDSYPLSSLQQGMLLHCLDTQGEGVYVDQILCVLDEEIDAPALVRAWRRVFERHPILRTSFSWEGIQGPIQNVHRQVEIPFELFDWRDFTHSDQQRRSEELMECDRRDGFDLSKAPITRLKLVRCAERQYKLLWTYHHILVDGRSIALIMDEVFQYYEAFRDGCDAEIPQPRLYRDYVDWQESQDFTQYEKYWRKTLDGFRSPTRLRLPPVEKNDYEVNQIFADQELTIPTDVAARVDAFAKAQDLTLNAMIQGVWSLLQHHYSGADDIVFGATRACRYSSVKGAESMVGLFLNTLPMRVKLNPQSRIVDILRDLRRQQVELRDYEQTPLRQIQAWSEVERGKALFESIVVFESMPPDGPLRSKGGEWLNRRFQHRGQSHYPLTFDVCVDSQLFLRIQYDRRRFDDGSIERMLGHLQNLLVGVIADPEQRVSDVAMLGAAEKQQLLSLCNSTKCDYETDACLHELFEQQAERTPDAVAVVVEERHLTYRELNRRANHLARKIRSLGVGRGGLVGLCVERSLEMIVGILGVLKAGGAYVPLDPIYPKDRLAFMMADARVAVLLTQKALTATLPVHDAQVLCLDTSGRADATDANPLNGVTPDDLAYVMYTSGSTGKPKGVQITHRNVTRLFQATHGWFRFYATDVWTLFHSYAFDFSVWEIWGALLNGGKLVVVPYCLSRSPESFYALLSKENVTVLNQTPSAFRQLIDVEQSTEHRRELALRYVIFGGEALDFISLKPWFDAHGDRQPQLVNMYGITETTVHVTYRPITAADTGAGTGSLIGVPIPDLKLYILDRYRNPVPIGLPGELYVGGAGVAKGYLNRPELTSARFIANPFDPQSAGKLYRSGDLVRLMPNRDIEYLGRIDTQTKIRGFRIELGEIEAVLRQHPKVEQVVATVREDVPGDQRLTAYVVSQEKLSLLVDELRAYTKKKLPNYMVPATFVMLDGFPLTANGKLDRDSLPKSNTKGCEHENAFIAPQTDLEKKLAAVWQGLLQVRQVGLHDNFFDLGGHSLLLIHLHSYLKKSLGMDLSVVDLFEYPTVSTLAKFLGGKSYDPPHTTNYEPNHAQIEQRKMRMAQQRQQRRQLAGKT